MLCSLDRLEAIILKLKSVALFQMKKAGLFTWVFTATLFSVLPLTSLPAKAEGGCPQGLYPAGGGYCRNIWCPQFGDGGTPEESTKAVMKKYNLECYNLFGYGAWGNTIVPMR